MLEETQKKKKIKRKKLRGLAAKLEATPAEHRAHVYKAHQAQSAARRSERTKKQKESLRVTLKALEKQLKITTILEKKEPITRQILKTRKDIKKISSKRKWSPILAGSFEGGR